MKICVTDQHWIPGYQPHGFRISPKPSLKTKRCRLISGFNSVFTLILLMIAQADPVPCNHCTGIILSKWWAPIQKPSLCAVTRGLLGMCLSSSCCGGNSCRAAGRSRASQSEQQLCWEEELKVFLFLLLSFLPPYSLAGPYTMSCSCLQPFC